MDKISFKNATANIYQLKIRLIVSLQVKAGTKAVDDHLKPDVRHLIHHVVKHGRVLCNHVEEDWVLLRVRCQQTHLAFQCQVEPLLVCRTHNELVNSE